MRWRKWRNWGARVHEVTIAGLRAVVLENERLRVTILADKGTDIVEFNDKRRDLDFNWFTPTGIRNPADTVAGSDPVGTFHDIFPGGWQEIFPSAGRPTTYRGTSLAQHAEVSVQPWDYEIVADDEGEVAVRFSVQTVRLPYRLTKTFRLASGDTTLRVEEEAVNEAPVAMDAMWGQHLAFGRPFLKPGHRIWLPDGVEVLPHQDDVARRMTRNGPHQWPIVPAISGGTIDLSIIPDPGTPSEMAYLAGFTEGWYELTNAERTAGVRVEWDAQVLPYLWFWQELGASADYPFWGQFYTVGLEPCSSYPTSGLSSGVDSGTALAFAPGERKSLSWSVAVLSGDES